MCVKHMCRVHKTFEDCVIFRCSTCELAYAVDRVFLNHIMKGVWPFWRINEVGVRW